MRHVTEYSPAKTGEQSENITHLMYGPEGKQLVLFSRES